MADIDIEDAIMQVTNVTFAMRELLTWENPVDGDRHTAVMWLSSELGKAVLNLNRSYHGNDFEEQGLLDYRDTSVSKFRELGRAVLDLSEEDQDWLLERMEAGDKTEEIAKRAEAEGRLKWRAGQ